MKAEVVEAGCCHGGTARPSPLCRAELPSTATPELPIRCSRREQCERYRLALTQWRLNVVNWACDRNSFDAFVPVQPVRD